MLQNVLRVFTESLLHNAGYLAAGVLLAALIEAFADRERVAAILSRTGWAGVIVGTAVGALTPLCSCGTAAIMLSLVAAGVPWPPVVAFLVSSPLMSPSIYALTAGVMGFRMANAKLAAAIVLGLASGGAAMLLQERGVLSGRTSRACCDTGSKAAPCCGSGGAPVGQDPAAVKPAVRRLVSALKTQGVFVMKYFVLYSFIGALMQVLVPQRWVEAVFGTGRPLSILTAALVGVPLYMSGTASIPLTGAMVQMGMDKGAALAFLISGPGTHFGALAAVAIIAPRPVLWLYLVTVLVGAVAAGWLFSMV